MPNRRLEMLSPVGQSTVNRNFHTPVNAEYVSPLGRRHLTINNTTQKSPSTFLVPEQMNDDEAEKRERQLIKVLELQQRNLATSPITPVDRRLSLPLGGLSNKQLADHYADCIKLSTENKISAKNAFGLHLIDYMSELFKKKDVTDFQLASSTLDASAKIYAGRVDAIHSEMYKVLTGLGRGGNEKPEKAAGDDEEEEMEPGEDRPNEEERKRKRARKSHTIEANLKNITVNKIDLEFEVDPLFQKSLAAFDEGGTGGLLLNHLKCFEDTCELVLDSNTVVSFLDNDTSSSQKTRNSRLVDVKELKNMTSGVVDFNSLQICPAFSKFEFVNWSLEDEKPSKCAERLGKNEHAFDLEAEPEPIEDAQTETGAADIIDDGYGPVGDDDDDDEAANNSGTTNRSNDAIFSNQDAESHLLENAVANIKSGAMNSLMQVLTSEPSDYSYFKTDLLRTWAGPEHWKLQPRVKDSTTLADKTAGKKTKSKEAFFVDFEEEIDIDWHFKQTKAATTVTKGTLEKHSRQLTTLPEDLHYDANNLLQLFLMSAVIIKRQSDNSQTIEVAQYNYDNANDRCNFCPEAEGLPANVDDDDDAGCGMDFNLTEGDYNQTQFSGATSQGAFGDGTYVGDMLVGDNLVPQPRKSTEERKKGKVLHFNKLNTTEHTATVVQITNAPSLHAVLSVVGLTLIAKIDIDYAKVAKKVDVKRLKAVMWDILSKQSTSDKTPSIKSAKDSEGESSTFQGLMNELVPRLSQTMVQNLSVPIAFVCLLHIANEKNLKISNLGDMTDLKVALE